MAKTATPPAYPAPARLTKATDPRLFSCSQQGNVACVEHVGSYGASAIAARPNAHRWETPLNIWYPVSALEVAMWLEEFGSPLACETCGHQVQP